MRLSFTRVYAADTAHCHNFDKSFDSSNISSLSKHFSKVHHIQTEIFTVFNQPSTASSYTLVAGVPTLGVSNHKSDCLAASSYSSTFVETQI